MTCVSNLISKERKQIIQLLYVRGVEEGDTWNLRQHLKPSLVFNRRMSIPTHRSKVNFDVFALKCFLFKKIHSFR